MPTYDYLCEKCKSEFEVTKRMTDPPPKTCPFCNSRKVSRLFTPPNVPSVGKSGEPHPSVADRLKPTGHQGAMPFYGNNLGGLQAMSFVGGRGIVMHPNLSGPPPGCDSKDGRVVVTKKEPD